MVLGDMWCSYALGLLIVRHGISLVNSAALVTISLCVHVCTCACVYICT